MDDDIRKDLKLWIEKTAEKMGESTLFVSMFTENYTNSIGALIQFSMALVMNKPIFLLVPRGFPIPEKILRVADGLAYYDPGDADTIFAATQELLLKAAAIFERK